LLATCAVGLSAGILYYGFNGSNSDPSVGPDPATRLVDVGQGVPTDFGAMAVERVERRALGARGERLDVTVALINLAAAPFPVAEADVGVRRGDGRLLRGARSSGSVAYVAPREATRVTYRFHLPTAAPRLQIELTDATMARPAVVELGASTGIPILKELDAPPHAH
jgi:hypothetical protein